MQWGTRNISTTGIPCIQCLAWTSRPAFVASVCYPGLFRDLMTHNIVSSDRARSIMNRQRERRDSRERESNWKSSRDRGRGSPPPGKAPSRYRDTRNIDPENGGHGKAERHFTNRCKLFIGNLPNGTTEKDITELFSPFGGTDDAFIAAGRNFGFIKLVREVDGVVPQY